MSHELYRCKPRQIRELVIEVLQAGLVPFVQSSPGLGKSSIMRSIADEMNLKLIDHRLSTSAPEDMSGLPRFTNDGKAVFAPFAELFPLEDSLLPLLPGEKEYKYSKGEIINAYDGWMLFLDEMNSASRAVGAAAYKLILDRMTGQHKLHQRCVITAAGNLDTDRAIVQNLGTAMQSRLIHLEMQPDFQEWLEDIAYPYDYDRRIIAYLNRYPDKLMAFDPNHKDKTFNCPRTWEFTSKFIKDKDITSTRAIALQGFLSSATAVEFVQFCAVYKDLVDVKEILANPDSCRIPTDINIQYATITHMIEHADAANFDGLTRYADRMQIPLRLVFYRSVMQIKPDLRFHPATVRAMVTLSNYINTP